MSSYYSRVIGSLAATEIARSEDIHLIQSNIQSAFQDMIKDTFGQGCILGEEEDSLKLIPTPDHIDQENDNFDVEENNRFISFYDKYLRQTIDISKSEIESIRINVRNDSNLTPTIFAEIRDVDMTLLKEASVKLDSTINEVDPIQIEFSFNLEHLPLGTYYFVLRPVDISSVDMAENGDETIYDTITPEMFLVQYDNGGNYLEGLYASYNGVDYLESRVLDDRINFDDDMVEVSDTNFDLCFEQVFSSGNTYLINPAPCMVMGEKIYPIDTHVTIDGPSPQGDRIDLITLTTDGTLNVTRGEPYSGTKKYPINNSGFKVAYITTYKTSDAEWTCPECDTVNNANISACTNCGTTTNIKIPLIEQDDDNNITRQRDVLERLRRLEKKMSYQINNNSPSRVKYVCTVDPTMAIDAIPVKETTPDGKEITRYAYVEDTYGMSKGVDENGNPVILFGEDGGSENLKWSIAENIITSTAKTTNKTAWLSASDQLMGKGDYKFYVAVTEKKPKGAFLTNKKVRETYKGVREVPVTVYIKNNKGRVLQTIKAETNTTGLITLGFGGYRLKDGNYKVVTKYGSTQIKNTIKISSKKNAQLTEKVQKAKITIKTTTSATKTNSIASSTYTYTGDDAFYKDNVTVDVDNGTAYISKLSKNSADYKTVDNIGKANLSTSNKEYKIKSSTSSLQSEYAMLNLTFNKDFAIKSLTPSIKKFQNISHYRLIFFKNDKVFDINNSRKQHVKNIKGDTIFPNIYDSGWEKVTGTKSGSGIKPKAKKFSFAEKKLTKGTYSILILGKLKNKKKDGYITFQQYHTSKATTYGAVSRVKGTSTPKKVFIEANSLTNRTWKIQMEKYDDTYMDQGILISKTVNMPKNITACSVDANYTVPTGCSVVTYVSNNGGKTYTEVIDGKATFTGLGHDFKWRILFYGTGGNTPKLVYEKSEGYAIKFTLSLRQNYVGYEDFGRCFSTPMLNANTITKSLVQNANVRNKFEEWEFCRLWMDDQDKATTMDICFAYDDTKDVSTTTKQADWPSEVFFSQILSNLNVDDFTNTSIDYDNYNASVEPDEHNFRFKFDSNLYNINDTIIASPRNVTSNQYNYFYGDITNEDIDMSHFSYGLMDMPVQYLDHSGDENNYKQYAGVKTISGPYYQALYNATSKDAEEDNDTESDQQTQAETQEGAQTETQTEAQTGSQEGTQEETQAVDITSSTCWAADGGDEDYDPNACIIGVSFTNGITITDEFTNLKIDIFPNLRECNESDSTTGELILTNGLPTVKTSYNYDTRYKNAENFCYIPAGTLELVISLNPYGLIEENNVSYGKAYTITSDLISCHHNEIGINLSDLYGATIYSIGIRVNTKTDAQGNPVVAWTADGKHPSLHANDILGIGNISLSGYNIYPYVPYIYTGNTNRWNWKALSNAVNSQAYIQYRTTAGKYVQLPINKNNPDSTYTNIEVLANNQYIGQDQQTTTLYDKAGTKITVVSTDNIYQKRFQGSNRIKLYNTDNTEYGISTDDADVIKFLLAASELDNLFKIDTNINLAPYDWIDVKYYIEQIGEEKPQEEIMKGEVTLDLYDTTDIDSVSPVESLALPAWGKVQQKYNGDNKTVNAWFKIHTQASTIKTIVLSRNNPTGRTVTDLNLVISDIVFLNTNGVPALGPQMHMRIYPKDMTSLSNTKIRKFGCVYRLG